MNSLSSFPRSRLGFELTDLGRRWRRALDTRLAQAGLTNATWTPLFHLHEFGDGIFQKDLAVRVGLDSSSLVRLLDILDNGGLIERREDSKDRRAKRIFLTEQGHQEILNIRQALQSIELDILADVSDAEIDVIRNAFAKISARVQAVLDEQPEQA